MECFLFLIKLFLPGAGFLQTIDLIYNAIQTIIAKANELKALVDALTMAAGDLVNNNLGGATANVVDALNDITGIAISFIARYAGMTKITNKINEIIEKISGKIRKVYEDIKAFITKKIEGLVGKVKALFHKWAPIIFHVGEGKHKEEHRIYLEEVGGKPEVFVRSTPKTIPEKLKEWKGQKQPKDKANTTKLMGDVMTYYEKTKVEATRPKEKDKNGKDKKATLTYPEKTLAQKMKELFVIYEQQDEDMRPILKEQTVIKHQGNVSTAIITMKKAGKAKTTDKATGWLNHAQKINVLHDPENNGRGGPWVKGHKIGHHLGGDGMKKDNIFIIDRSANSQMLHKAEDPVHVLLQELITLEKKDDEKKYKARHNKVIYYIVKYTPSNIVEGYANNIFIEWGLQDFGSDNSRDPLGSAEDIKLSEPIVAEVPSAYDQLPEPVYSINQTSCRKLYKRAVDKGYSIPPKFWEGLARIKVENPNLVFTEKKLKIQILKYFDYSKFKMSRENVEKKHIPTLMKVINDPKTKITL